MKLLIRLQAHQKNSSKEFHSPELLSNEANNEIPKERHMSPQERQQIMDELRLI